MKTVLFVGAGRHQRRAILQARDHGILAVSIDLEAGDRVEAAARHLDVGVFP